MYIYERNRKMSLTIGEVLENAIYNLEAKNGFQYEIGMGQLKNAYKLLDEKGKDFEDTFNDEDLV
jgi:hypothetical protein